MANFSTWKQFVTAANGHLSTTEARQMADTIYDVTDSLWTAPTSLGGISADVARGRCAQRLITNPSLPEFEVTQLSNIANNPAVATIKKFDKSTGSDQPVKFLEGRKVRVDNFKRKYGHTAC